MKTNYFSNQKLSIYSLFGFFIILSSCGSYQNSSYYETDGIYGSSEKKITEPTVIQDSPNNKYKEYFSSLNKEYEESEIFTNVDNYNSSPNDSIVNNERNYNTENASWGSNPQSVTINVYDNNWGYNNWNNYWYGNYWGYNNWYGPSWGFGWNSWYGPNWGWGLGWNNWYGGGYYGWNNGYGNGYYNNYSHAQGRRGSSYSSGITSTRNGNRSNNVGRRGSSVATGTRSNTFTTTRSQTSTRNTNFNTTRNNSTRNNNSNVSPTNSVRTQTSPTRSYTPSSNYGSGRSSSGSGFGGGSSSGGGRSSSGGRR